MTEISFVFVRLPVLLTMKTAAINKELTTQPPVNFLPLVLLKWNHRKLARPKANQVEKSDETFIKVNVRRMMNGRHLPIDHIPMVRRELKN